MTKSYLRINGAIAGVALLLAAGQSSQAVTINGGLGLLTPEGGAWLETQLGEGPLLLTSIFTHTPGDGLTSLDFHAAADFQGRTFVIMEGLLSTGTEIIGGYNPQNWNQMLGNYTLTSDVADRTAAIFNLSELRWLQQNAGDSGVYQTYNSPFQGPTFGAGHDFSTSQNLSLGQFNPGSYGSDGLDVFGERGGSAGLGRIEVFTIAAAPNGNPSVPDGGASLTLLGAGLFGVALLRRRVAQ